MRTGDQAIAHGSSQIVGCFREGRCSCSFGCETDGVQERGSSEPLLSELTMDHYHHAVLRDDSRSSSFSVDRQAVATRTLLLARRRTSGGLNTVTGTGRSSRFDAL